MSELYTTRLNAVPVHPPYSPSSLQPPSVPGTFVLEPLFLEHSCARLWNKSLLVSAIAMNVIINIIYMVPRYCASLRGRNSVVPWGGYPTQFTIANWDYRPLSAAVYPRFLHCSHISTWFVFVFRTWIGIVFHAPYRWHVSCDIPLPIGNILYQVPGTWHPGT